MQERRNSVWAVDQSVQGKSEHEMFCSGFRQYHDCNPDEKFVGETLSVRVDSIAKGVEVVAVT